MAKGALFVGWGAIIPGREEAAPKVLNEAVQGGAVAGAAATGGAHRQIRGRGAGTKRR